VGVLHFESHAIVTDMKDKFVRRFGTTNFYFRGFPRSRVFDRITDQVLENLLQLEFARNKRR